MNESEHQVIARWERRWVAFGGVMLLGGRLSDLLGARRVVISGWAVLLAGSVVAGAAGNAAVELAGRAVQGAGAALIARRGRGA